MDYTNRDNTWELHACTYLTDPLQQLDLELKVLDGKIQFEFVVMPKRWTNFLPGTVKLAVLDPAN